MITPAWVAMMARYNAWQNGWVIEACEALGDAKRRTDRGLFFGSIHGTLSHILWGDQMWLARFTGGDLPGIRIADSGDYVTDWSALVHQRAETDAALVDWAGGVTGDWLDTDYSWHSKAAGRQVSRPMAQVVTHLFNHQTHHRGQIHAALTQTGQATRDTDLFFLEPD
ncbi:DinB family protein [Palleronia pelagia]|uniref:Uncharacterized damage-inducible protein DinB (Forms a four-helix bundle) n=1 Tax=Palleronia pelagia TaxID=387096 RepID=A0A1H8AD25_9RHOB|nr:DinB family protein [Palleronia pelagia]SEM68491.1 Uncharacterized damage-inducible protein DinB (forms a four-helix bundle) [Palleronia pelagia]